MSERANDELVAQFTAAFAARLKEAIGTRSMRSVAESVGLNHTTVSRLVRGERVPDAVTIWMLEAALDADLWPSSEHRPVFGVAKPKT